jgi:hypothetical protein
MARMSKSYWFTDSAYAHFKVKEEDKDKPKNKETLRIDTSTASPASVEFRRQPGPLNLTYGSKRDSITPSLPSALATA